MHAATGAWEALPSEMPWTAKDGTPFWMLRDRAEAAVAELNAVTARLAGPPDKERLLDPVVVAMLAEQSGELAAALRELTKTELAVKRLIDFGRLLCYRAHQRDPRPGPPRPLRAICPRSGDS